MIYQLKVSIEDISPVAWRKVLIHADASLLHLHEVIQALFEWENRHLHEFHVLQSNGQTPGDRLIRIGTSHPEEEVSFFQEGYAYEETEEKLADWLIQEQDKLLYIYDFGDDWQHEVILEKVIKKNTGQFLPSCIDIQGAAPEEDSRFYWLEGGKGKQPNYGKLMNEINTRLSKISQAISHHTKKTDSRRLLELASEFKALKPWTYMRDCDIFGIEAVKQELVWCSVLGKSGQEVGLSVFIGPEGWHALNTLIFSDRPGNIMMDYRGLQLTFSDRSELNAKDYRLIKDEGLTFRGKKQWPQFRSFSSGKIPWHLSCQEIGMFCRILEQAVIVCSQVKAGFTIPEFGEEHLYARISSETGSWEDVLVSVPEEDSIEFPEEFSLMVSELDIHKIKKTRKRSGQICEIGIINRTVPVQENKDEAPYAPLIFLVVERENGLILYHELLTTDDVFAGIQSAFLSFLAFSEELPGEIWLEEDNFPVLKPVADKFGIVLEKVKDLAVIAEVKELMPDDGF